MNRMSVFNSPFLLGFEQFERTIDRISKLSTETYPPYNIEQISSNLLRITVAVAGFEKADLEINLEGNQLQIKGFKKEENDERIFLHRGIATRQFQRNFVLAEGIEVEGASMENGLLSVDLSQPINSEESKKIEIKDSSKSNNEKFISLENGKSNRQK
ncbi:MAG: heat-shock protein Hsp20 [Rickettsiales bacterium]|mgnify:CR=1 FL=1|nr:heat-shock protein Hsp20 [Rickettsiales bacterium]RPG14846.1 MAG: heat-shock protein Hsp20 [Pelagibacteraceae bacterium TMED195]|tara:strand:- start:772 stop:1245 length:474 start_codon:yes stop_codon:yes gene_type:complete